MPRAWNAPNPTANGKSLAFQDKAQARLQKTPGVRDAASRFANNLPRQWLAAAQECHSLRVDLAMFTIAESVRITKCQDGGVLLDVARGTMFTLNPVGARILELLQQKCGLPLLVAQISREFGAPGEVVRADVEEFLSVLRSQGLLANGAA